MRISCAIVAIEIAMPRPTARMIWIIIRFPITFSTIAMTTMKVRPSVA